MCEAMPVFLFEFWDLNSHTCLHPLHSPTLSHLSSVIGILIELSKQILVLGTIHFCKDARKDEGAKTGRQTKTTVAGLETVALCRPVSPALLFGLACLVFAV